MEREYRVASETWPMEDLDIRAEGDGLHFTGYAAVFNSPSEEMAGGPRGSFREIIRPGAFTVTLRERRRAVKMFLNHNTDIVLASTRQNTLKLAEDERGLRVEADLPNNEWGRPVADAVGRKDIDSMSFSFSLSSSKPDESERWSADNRTRELVQVRLYEVSPVTAWPAYTATSASVRSLIDAVDWQDTDAIDRIVGDLDEERRHALLVALNRGRKEPFIGPLAAAHRDRLAALMAEA